MRRLILSAMVVLGALSGFLERGTLAYLNDAGTSTGNAFTTGTVDLTNNQTTAVITFSTMIPGDQVTAPATPLTVTNSPGGTGEALAFRYSVTSKVATGSNDLAKRLDLLIGRQPAAGGTCNSTSTFGNPGSATGVDWTLIYQGDLAQGTGDINLIGNPAHTTTAPASWAAGAGEISGDRLLAGGVSATSEYLCFRIEFKPGADRIAAYATGEGGSNTHNFNDQDTAFDGSATTDNTYSGLSTTITFTFRAVQETLGA